MNEPALAETDRSDEGGPDPDAEATERALRRRVDRIVDDQVAIASRRLQASESTEGDGEDVETIARRIAEGVLEGVFATLEDDPSPRELETIRRLFELDASGRDGDRTDPTPYSNNATRSRTSTESRS